MRNYIIRRLLLMIPTLLLVSLIIFFMMRLIPGDIVDLMMSQIFGQSGGAGLAASNKDAIVEKLGLDVPVLTQYGRWIGVIPDKDGNIRGVLQGHLGKSLWKNRPVLDDIAVRWPVTLELGMMAIIIAQLIALPIGLFSAIRQDTWGDYVARSFAILCIAVPGFWVATMVVVFPAIWWNWAPNLFYVSLTKDPIGNLKMFIIPAIILGASMSGWTMRMTRTMMLEVLKQDYIRTAWAKGLKERVVIVRHALKNALIPVITIVGLQAQIIVGGTVIIEQIFQLPGMGRLIVDSTLRRDYPIVSGILLIFGVAIVILNLLTDISYAYLDPQIRYN
jgi:peptide/nickel transport system permease protein